MAEGGFDFGYDDPDLDNKLDHDDDDDDSDQKVDTTRPFQPTGASTPYHRGELHEMITMQQEQSGLPDTSYEETPLLGSNQDGIPDPILLGDLLEPEEKEGRLNRALDFIKSRFPKVDFKKLGPIKLK